MTHLVVLLLLLLSSSQGSCSSGSGDAMISVSVVKASIAVRGVVSFRRKKGSKV